MKIYLLLWT